MAANNSAGRAPLVIWAATVDPADVPMMTSASVTSTPTSHRPAMRPSSHALPAAPAPARTNALALAVARLSSGIALPFADRLRGAPGADPSAVIAHRSRQGAQPTTPGRWPA